MAEHRVVWTNTARRDLEEIVDYIAADTPSAALKVLDKIEQRCTKLTAMPERGRIVPELRRIDVLTYRELIARPWRIVYRYERKNVYVIAVLDSRRDLASLLLERLVR